MKRIIAISLLFIFMSGQMNLTWGAHYCSGFEVESTIMFGHDHLDCGMGEMMCCDESSTSSNSPIFIPEPCCTNEYHSADADDFFSQNEFSFNKQFAFTVSYVNSLFDFSQTNFQQNFILADSPPILNSDRLVLHQSFLL